MTAPGTTSAASTSKPAGGSVWLVVYLDDLHVYPESAEQSARMLYTVGVAATGEGEIRKVPGDVWERARKTLRGQVPIKDHTAGQN